jgi:hypothetical protein
VASISRPDDKAAPASKIVDLQLEREWREAAGKAAAQLSAFRSGTASFSSLMMALIAPFNHAPELSSERQAVTRDGRAVRRQVEAVTDKPRRAAARDLGEDGATAEGVGRGRARARN